ncbi:MAG: hypothetical protein ACE5J9_09370 [Methanosarcinales archaeon]
MEIFNKLKQEIDGFIGACLVDDEKGVITTNIPDLIQECITEVLEDIMDHIDIVKDYWGLNNIVYDLNDIQMIIFPTKKYTLITLVSTDLNYSMFNLLIKRTIKKLDKIDIKELFTKEEPKITATEKTEYNITEIAMQKIYEISEKFLGNMSKTLVENVFKKLGVDKENATKEDLISIASGIKKSSSMFIGPSNAKKIYDKLYKEIESLYKS